MRPQCSTLMAVGSSNTNGTAGATEGAERASAEGGVFVDAFAEAHMIPGAFVMLAALPRSPSGKIDRRALPMPEAVPGAAGAPFEPPCTSTEQVIAAIWQEVLGASRVGRRDDFFDLGGHSLLAAKVMARLAEVLHVELSLATLFEARTVAALAEIADIVAGAGPRAGAPEGFEEGEL
jgi:acyl carrier protein